MPISDQFVNEDAPEWTWGNPSEQVPTQSAVEAAQSPATSTEPHEEDAVIGRPWLDVLMAIVIFLGAQLIVGALAMIAYILIAIPDVNLGRLQFIQQDYPGIMPAIVIPTAISTILMAWGWAHVGNRTPAKLMNWGLAKTDFLWGLFAVVVSVVIGNALGLVLKVPAEESSQLNNAIWPEHVTPTIAIAMVIGVGVLVPVAEEMVFRGIIQNAFARRFNQGIGLLLSTIFFAVPHIPNFTLLKVSTASMVAGMIQVTLLGFVIGGIMVYTRRLGPCIYAHIFNNCLAVGTLVYMDFFTG